MQLNDLTTPGALYMYALGPKNRLPPIEALLADATQMFDHESHTKETELNWF